MLSERDEKILEEGLEEVVYTGGNNVENIDIDGDGDIDSVYSDTVMNSQVSVGKNGRKDILPKKSTNRKTSIKVSSNADYHKYNMSLEERMKKAQEEYKKNQQKNRGNSIKVSDEPCL